MTDQPANGANPPANAARRMWCAVILQALADATAPPAPAPAKRRRRDEARDWLLVPNAHFAEVCALAEQEPDRVRAEATRLIESSDREPGSVRIKPGGNRSPRVPSRASAKDRGVGRDFNDKAGTGAQCSPQDRG